MWLQLRDCETDSLECLEAHFLIGRWSSGENSFEDCGSFRRWGCVGMGTEGNFESVVVV